MNEEKLKRILDELDRLYPDAHCELNYSNTLELLIAVMLSAQTTDASVNQLTKSLFQKYRSVEDYANAPLNQLENDLRRIGLYRAKAKNVKAMCQKLIDEFNSEVPCDLLLLQSLPGVGRKTANVVISEGFNVPAIAVDTHVERLSKRLGFAFKNDNLETVERKLMNKIPRDRWIKSHHQFIFFGRYQCKSLNPQCEGCHLIDICREPKRKKYM